MTMRWIAALAVISLSAACSTIAPSGAGSTANKAVTTNPVYVAADIAGKTSPEIDKALGAPDLVRIEGAGEFRRYALADCALIVLLYPDNAGVKRARHLDVGALKSGEEKPDLDRCLAHGKAQG